MLPPDEVARRIFFKATDFNEIPKHRVVLDWEFIVAMIEKGVRWGLSVGIREDLKDALIVKQAELIKRMDEEIDYICSHELRAEIKELAEKIKG